MSKKIGVCIAGLITGIVVCLGLIAGCSTNIDAITSATPELTGTIMDTNVNYKTFDGHNYSILNDNGSITITINDWDKFSSCKMYGCYNWVTNDVRTETWTMYTYEYNFIVDIDIQNIMGKPTVWVTTTLHEQCDDYDYTSPENKCEIIGIVNEDTNTMAFSFYVGDGANGNIDIIRGTWED